MKKILLLLGMLTCFLIAFGEKNEVHYFDIGLAAPKLQIHSKESDIVGVRLGIFHTEHQNMKGFDYSIFSSSIKGDFTGVQIGGVSNVVEGKTTGLQEGVINKNGNFSGLQIGILNENHTSKGGVFGVVNQGGNGKGVQFGFVNYSNAHTGLQIGLYNHAKVMNGVQLGLANYIGNNENLKLMPLMNFHFGI